MSKFEGILLLLTVLLSFYFFHHWDAFENFVAKLIH